MGERERPMLCFRSVMKTWSSGQAKRHIPIANSDSGKSDATSKLKVDFTYIIIDFQLASHLEFKLQ